MSTFSGEPHSAWWNRDNSVEIDAITRDAEHVLAIATIKWRSRGGVTRAEIAALAAARKIVSSTATARLIAVGPHGAVSNADADEAFTPDDLLTAWD